MITLIVSTAIAVTIATGLHKGLMKIVDSSELELMTKESNHRY